MFDKLIIGLIITVISPGFCLLGGSCAPARDFDNRLDFITGPYRFSIAKWEAGYIQSQVNQWGSGGHENTGSENTAVMAYFSLVSRIKDLKSELEAARIAGGDGTPASLEAELNVLEGQRLALESTVERTIQKQLKDTLAREGIFNPVAKYTGLKAIFPPLNFKLDKLPLLLVISPRDRIESIREITLLPGTSLEEIKYIEAEADKLGVSSCVVNIGGFGATYPTIVTNESDLRFILDTAAEEWLHQYLLFKPLGFLYLLDLTGISRNYEIATMNETLASMTSKEIGSLVCQEYYPSYQNGTRQHRAEESEFDFNREMREIRKAVDGYLAEGEIEQAEEFMEQKRLFLASMGYYIRRLNQAYFAFHGTYADSPTSVSPIGLELQQLRSQSTSLKDFLDTAAAMTNRQDLIYSVK